MRITWFLLAASLSLLASGNSATAEVPLFSSVEELDVPSGPGAREPMLSAMPDGRILLIWTEPVGEGAAVRVAIRNADGWTEPRTVVESPDLFVNWADFPSAIALTDGTLAAHWLKVNSETLYDYDVNVAFSKDEGRTWGAAIVPHQVGTKRQHGFVTLLNVDGGKMLAIWLDGRNYASTGGFAAGDSATDAMQLRSAVVGAGGRLSKEALLDGRTCTCCQTSAVRTDSGKVLVVYRDRTDGEMRDISISRLIDGVWSEPATVSRDGWNISGCPVNGPAVDSSAAHVAVAWFTAANDVPKVKVAVALPLNSAHGALGSVCCP